MSKKKNKYAKQAKKKAIRHGFASELPTKGNVKNTALETGKVVLVGVLGGGLIGAVIGKPSLLAGLATTGAGHYTGNRLLQLVGIGMMASGGFQKTNSVSGLDGMEGVKERVKAFKDSFSEKLYLDKLKKKTETTSGIGELQYFTYPSQEFSGDLAALSAIEDQLTESAMQFQGQLSNAELDMEGIEDYNF